MSIVEGSFISKSARGRDGRRRSRLALPASLVMALACGLVACASRSEPALYASSAEQPGYAIRFPQALGATRSELGSREDIARRTMGQIKTFPAGLDTEEWVLVGELYDQAEVDGRSESYAQAAEHSSGVLAFYASRRKEIRQRVAGAVQFAAKDGGCSEPPKLGGAASVALDRAMQEQSDEERRAYSEAHRSLSSYEARLGKATHGQLESELDAVLEASYLVSVGMEKSRRQMAAMIDEGADVEATLSDEIGRLNGALADERLPARDRTTLDEQLEAAKEALAQVDSEVDQARHVLSEADQRVARLKSDFEEVMDALRRRVAERASSSERTSAP